MLIPIPFIKKMYPIIRSRHLITLYFIFAGSLLSTTMAIATQPLNTNQGSDEYGTAYYVSPDGSNSNSGTQESPWKTIQHAADAVPVGSIVYVNSGTYPEHVIVTKAGTLQKRIAFKAIPERSAHMYGFEISASYVRVEAFDIEPGNGKDVGIFVKNGDNVAVVDNFISNCKIGIYVRSRGPLSNQLYIAGNKMYRCNMGIWLVANDSLIENNEVERLVQAYKVGRGLCQIFR